MTLDHMNTGSSPAPPGVGTLMLFLARMLMSNPLKQASVSLCPAQPVRWTKPSYWYCDSPTVS